MGHSTIVQLHCGLHVYW